MLPALYDSPWNMEEYYVATTQKSLQVKIFLLSRNDTAHPDEWAKVVVAATTEDMARQIANQESKSEGYVWTDGALVDAKEIGLAGDNVEGGVILAATE